MAKNFASVLDSLRLAGEDKTQEVDSVYALNCDWLLEQFKQTQASLLALVPTSRGAIQGIPEQQVRGRTCLAMYLHQSLQLDQGSDQSWRPAEHSQNGQPAGPDTGAVCFACRRSST